MPTEEICHHFNELRSDLVLLYELKSALSTCEFELQTLRHRFEAFNPGKVCNIMKTYTKLDFLYALLVSYKFISSSFVGQNSTLNKLIFLQIVQNSGSNSNGCSCDILSPNFFRRKYSSVEMWSLILSDQFQFLYLSSKVTYI